MPLTKTEKEKIVKELADKLRASRIAILADYRGLTVPKIQAVRKALKAQHATFQVAKKTLLKIALKGAGLGAEAIAGLKEAVGLAASPSADIDVAKALAKASKENPELKILGAFFEKRFIASAEVAELSRLPSREELLARLAGTLAAPLSGFARVLNGPVAGFITIINKLATKS